MIRDFQKQDLDRVMELWLETNGSAHSFIAKEYWESHYDSVKQMLPDATLYVYEENGVIQGFVGLMDDTIAGIFVCSQSQSKGVGKRLLDYAKTKREALCLQVYQKNSRAIAFYLREQFALYKEQVDENTGEVEWEMRWVKEKCAL